MEKSFPQFDTCFGIGELYVSYFSYHNYEYEGKFFFVFWIFFFFFFFELNFFLFWFTLGAPAEFGPLYVHFRKTEEVHRIALGIIKSLIPEMVNEVKLLIFLNFPNLNWNFTIPRTKKVHQASSRWRKRHSQCI